MAGHLGNRHHWISCVATMAVWLALGWPMLLAALSGRVSTTATLWLIAFGIFGAAAFGAMLPKIRPRLFWSLLCIQVAAVLALAVIAQWAMMSMFLLVTAWQVGMATTPVKALSWVAIQMLAVTVVLAVIPKPDVCWVLGKSLGLQVLLVLTAHALRWESKSARALARTNRELLAAQAIIAKTERDSERLRISRELHDAWGHELTALGLQLEIASRMTEPARANDHVMKAKGLARDLLAKVRNAVATLREEERFDLKQALEALAQGVQGAAVHVEIAPDVRVSPDQAPELVRRAQEAVAAAIDEAQATHLWLQVTPHGEGVRLAAHNDGSTVPSASAPGAAVAGLRERVERFRRRLAALTGFAFGSAVNGGLRPRTPHGA